MHVAFGMPIEVRLAGMFGPDERAKGCVVLMGPSAYGSRALVQVYAGASVLLVGPRREW
jgi:hypothetical protein